MAMTMNQSEFERLRHAAESGDPRAQEQLADLYARADRAPEARQWLARAADAGLASAATQLGLWEIVGFGGIQSVARGLSRIIASADAGHADAAHTAAILFGGGVGAPRDPREGLRRLVQAARLGQVRAAAQLGLLVGIGHSAGAWLLGRAAEAGSTIARSALGHGAAVAKAEPEWDGLAETIDLEWVDRPFERRIERNQPHIESLASFLPRWVCNYVIGMAAPLLSRGKVIDEHGGESVRGERSNAVMTFGLADSDFLLEMVNLRTARAVAMPPENAEGLGVLHYRPGESYAPHSDFIPETPANAAQLAARGQRLRTLLVYLNEGFEGGETAFPRLGVGFKPPAGCALIFHNVGADGCADPLTLHAGTSPTRGEKWVVSKWFRSKALRPAPVS
jgi:hypothetical protein